MLTLGDLRLGLDFNWVVALGFVSAIVVDLSLRYLAFGRLESLAIDSALFATIYNAIELVRHSGSPEAADWVWRTIGSTVCLLVLIAAHAALHRQLEAQIARVMRRLQDECPDSAERDRLRGVADVARHSILVTFIGLGRKRQDIAAESQATANEEVEHDQPLVVLPQGLRGGKRRWREDVVEHLKSVAPSIAPRVHEEDFLLGGKARIGAFIAFLILGAGAIVTPMVTITLR